MTVSEIAEEHGVSRQTVHSYRRRGTFPKPVEGEGSTRPRFRTDEVAAWFEVNPPRQGKRTDLATKTQRPEEPRMKTYVLTMRVEAAPEVTPAQIRQEIYDACGDVPFGFHITGIEEAQDG